MLKRYLIDLNKVSLCLLTFFFMFMTVNFAFSQDTPSKITNTLTLSQAIKIALKNSPMIHYEKNLVTSSKKAKLRARGALFPKITAYANYTRFNIPTTVTPISGFGPTAPPPVFSRDQYRAGLRFYLPIYKGGKLWTGLKQAEKEIGISIKGLVLTKENLVAQVIDTFNRILFLKDFISAQKKSLYALKVERDHAALMLKLGRIAPLDLMEIDTQIASQKINIVKAEQELLRSKQHLCYLLGFSPHKNIRLVGFIPKKINYFPPNYKDLDSLVDNRPDVARLKQLVEKARLAVSMAKAQNLPSLELLGDYGQRAGWGLNEHKEVWSVTLQLSVNIFSGGSISASISEAQAKVLALENKLRDLKLLAKSQILSSISSLKEANARIELAKQAQKTAKEAFRIQSLRYETGAGTVTDMLKAQASWANAQADFIQSLFDRQRAVVSLELSSGTILSDYKSLLPQK